jgi:L-lactate dehydrogenase complex protein LldF
MSSSAALPFYRRVDAALGDAALQTALERATSRFVGNRAAALATLTDAEGLRDQARAVRAKALSRLDELLERLADRIEARGGHVFWAADGEAARRYIVDLARARGARLVVKSKSMASEEIQLNHALEPAGVDVVETDLGEYIIQLAGETPSHIIAPAIHKTREQVAALFHKHLGVDSGSDVRALALAARQALRQQFLRADIGISGVNFGIANEGAIVLVTNEGNGRLTTTVPPVHVAVMGIERIVESLDDLGVLLQLLARSATGQKLTTYTSIISGPARNGEPDGPEEFHLVLLDNGRSRMLGGEYAESLLCIRCGACLNVCPVYGAIGGHAYGGVYSGPIGAVLTPLLEPTVVDAYDLAHASSLCGACEAACPVRIAIPDMLLRLRSDNVDQGNTPRGEKMMIRVWGATMRHPALYRVAGHLAALVTRLLARTGRVRALPPPLNAWTRARDFPPFAARSFTEQWRDRRSQAEHGRR